MSATSATRFFGRFLRQGLLLEQQQLLRLLHFVLAAVPITMAIMARRPSTRRPTHPHITECITRYGFAAIIEPMGHGSPDTGDIETSGGVQSIIFIPTARAAGVIRPVPSPRPFSLSAVGLLLPAHHLRAPVCANSYVTPC